MNKNVIFPIAILLILSTSCISSNSPNLDQSSPATNIQPKKIKRQGLHNFVVQKNIDVASALGKIKPDRIEIISGRKHRAYFSGDDLRDLNSVKVIMPSKGEKIILQAFKDNKKVLVKVVK